MQVSKSNIKKKTPIKEMSDEQLKRRLVKYVGITVLTVLAVFLSLTVFGPQVGGVLAYFSIHRNERDKSNDLTPNSPIFSNVPKAVKSEILTINGYSEPGTRIKLFVNGPETSETTADNDGLFTFVNITLTKGTNIIYAKAIDKNNLESNPSEKLEIEYNTDKPEITLDTPKDGETISNLDKRVLVKGKVNKLATVKVNGRFAILNNDLTFEVLLGVSEGNVEIKVEAIDEAGNKDEKTINIKYEKRGV